MQDNCIHIFIIYSLDAKGGAHPPLSEVCSYITLYSNGTVVCHGYTVIMIFCNIGLSRFPSDSYNCRLCFGSRNYEKNEIDLDWWDARIYKIINKIKPDAREWEVMVNVDYENSSQCNNVDQLDASKIVIKMTITRKAIAYHLTLFVPCLFLSVIMFLAFIVSTETGQRLSLIVTVLLTITVFQQFTLDILPPYSLPVLSRYYLFSLLLAFVSTVIDIVLLNTYTRSRRNLPELVHTVFIEWIGSLIYMTRNYYNYETGKYDIRHQDVKNALEQEIDIPKSKTAGGGHTIYSISFEGKSHWNSLPRPTDYLRKRNKKLTIDALAEEKERKQREKNTELEKTVLHDYKETEKRITEEVNRHQIFRLVRVLDRLFLFTSVFAVLVYSIYYLLRVLR